MRLAYMGCAASTALWASTLDSSALYSSTRDQLHRLCTPHNTHSSGSALHYSAEHHSFHAHACLLLHTPAGSPPCLLHIMHRLCTPYHTVQNHTMPCHAIPYHTIPHHTITYHTIPYHTSASAGSLIASMWVINSVALALDDCCAHKVHKGGCVSLIGTLGLLLKMSSSKGQAGHAKHSAEMTWQQLYCFVGDGSCHSVIPAEGCAHTTGHQLAKHLTHSRQCESDAFTDPHLPPPPAFTV